VARSPVYYGWVVLLAGTLGTIMTTPGQTVGVSVFVDRIVADLGLARSQVSLAYAMGTLGGSVALPFVGRFIDRFGPRVTVTLVSAGFVIACATMSWVGGLLALTLGFVLIRGLGQGSLTLVSLHTITIWFSRRRGLAVGIASVGFAVGIAVLPRGIEALIGQVGWRQAYRLLGIAVAATILPVGAMLFRGRPELFGLSLDQSPQGAQLPRMARPPIQPPKPAAAWCSGPLRWAMPSSRRWPQA